MIDSQELREIAGLVSPKDLVDIIADTALEEEGITVKDPSYHSARFAALKAADLAIGLTAQTPEGEAAALGVREESDGRTA